MRHSRGDKRFRAHRPKGGSSGGASVFGKVAGVAGLAVAASLVGAHVFHTPQTAAATSAKETVIVHEMPSKSDLELADDAKKVAANFDVEGLASLPEDKLVDQANESYQVLQEVIDKASTEADHYWVHRDVPAPLAQGCRNGDIPTWVIDVVSPGVSAGSAELAETVVPLEVERPLVDAPEVEVAIEDFEASVAALPIKDQLKVAPVDQVDLAAASNEELEEVLAEEEIRPVRLESDRRLSENLPDLSKVENGKLAPELLCPIPWHPNYSLLCASVPNLERLNEAFKKEFGHDLAIQSAYRSYEEQVWAHQASPSMTTLPGTSNHSWGLAVDFDIAGYSHYDHPEVAWLVENAPDYGWRNPKHESFATANPEPWHFEFGTKYSDEPDWGFMGPIPEVLYEIRLPEDSRPKTLLSER